MSNYDEWWSIEAKNELNNKEQKHTIWKVFTKSIICK